MKNSYKKVIFMMMPETPEKRKFPASQWIKRFGFAGFMFFLIKGLLWLIVPALVAYLAW
ncbi:MAG TPA: hypothetical protein VGB68_17955 [Pyrinomonadaceae bacterium]